jgi:D-alanyl-D-alanine carboxypeptidase
MMRIGVLIVVMMMVLVLPVAAQEDATLQAALQAYADETLREDETAALAVQVSRGDETVSAVVGLADGERAATVEDGFRIASMSKTFVAVTALLMQEEGLLSLDDAAAAYLPDEVVENIANLDGDDGATLRELLAMQSGIDDYLGTDDFWIKVEEEPTFAWTASEALTYAYDLPPLFAPGEEVSYSNTNYLLMQLVLEDAGDAPLHELVREYVLDPLGMARTYTQAFEAPPEGATLVRGYYDMDGDGVVEDVSGINDGFGLGDGALVSTLGDLTTFYRALLVEQTLLPADALAQMQAFAPDDFGDYGLGLARFDSAFGDAIGHSGGVLGFLSIGLVLQDDVIVVALCATEACSPEEMAVLALEAVMGG